MALPHALRRFFRDYVAFSGRSAAVEYWWITLLWWALGVTPTVVLTLIGTSRSQSRYMDTFQYAALWYALAFAVAFGLGYVAMMVRRTHDVGLSPVVPIAIAFVVPFIGFLVAAIIVGLPGNRGANAHGPDPRAQIAAERAARAQAATTGVMTGSPGSIAHQSAPTTIHSAQPTAQSGPIIAPPLDGVRPGDMSNTTPGLFHPGRRRR